MIKSAKIVASLAVALLAVNSARAEPFIEHLSPPALERGKTTRLTVVGSQLASAVDLWTALPSGKIKATPVGTTTEKSAVLDVAVADDAPVGVFGLRLATVDGLSNVQLALIDDLPVRPRPAKAATPAKVTLPVALWGTFEEAQVDGFAIDVTAGQQVSFEAVGNRFGKDVDPLVTIRDADGKFVAERDNDAGLYFDCRFAHTFAKAGTYTVEIRDARNRGNPHGKYVLRMGRFPAGRVVVPAAIATKATAEFVLPEVGDKPFAVKAPDDLTTGSFFAALRGPDDQGSTWVPVAVVSTDITTARGTNTSPATAIPAKTPGVLCGVLSKPGERNYFQLELKAGQRIQVQGEARALNSPADLELLITDAMGKELRRASDTNDDNVTNLDFQAPKKDIYRLVVRDLAHDGGPAFAYRIEVRNVSPRFEVSADVEGLTVPQGSYQPIPLTVQRTDYAGPIALSLHSAPPGVTLAPTEIPAGATTVVCQLSATAATPLGVSTLRIMAEPVVHWESPALRLAVGGLPRLPAGQQDLFRLPVRTRPMIDRQLLNVDLIPYTLREDQRRVPPALTDRFALQITPPSPFTMELPERALTLARYQHVDFPIVTTRIAGFDGPITFTARGGQIADKNEGRTRVYADFEEGTAARLQPTGSIHSRILTNLTKHRVDVFGTGSYKGRRVTLQRTFEIDIRSAFEVTAAAPKAAVKPGDTVRVRLEAKRVKTFDADIAVQLSTPSALGLAPKTTIPRGKDAVEVEIKVPMDMQPGRHGVALTATAVVDKFEEEYRGRFEIEVQKPDMLKK